MSSRVRFLLLVGVATALALVPAAGAAAAGSTTNINIAGTGSGTVTGEILDAGTFESTPVNCSGPPPTGECGPFVSSAGAFVIVEAHPDEGSEIEKWEWTGEVSPEESGCEEEGEAFESCSANNPEGEENTLTVVFKSSATPGSTTNINIAGTGSGTVTGEILDAGTFESTPVNCSGPPPTGECGPFVSSAGAFVIVEAHPDEGSEIEKWEWTGEVSPEESGCEEEGEAFESCSANNPEGEENTLTVVFKSSATPGSTTNINIAGTGSGTVTGEILDAGTFESTPVNCSGPPPTGECGPFVSSAGAFVIVEAHPDEGSEIEKWEWTGEVSPEESGCEEEGEAFESCSANNPEGEENTLTVVFKSSATPGSTTNINIAGTGSGTVTGEVLDAGTFESTPVNCSGPPPTGECGPFVSSAGAFVIVEAHPDEGSEIEKWEWTGEVSPEESGCEEEGEAFESCSANNPEGEENTLTVVFKSSATPGSTTNINIAGTGSGTVTGEILDAGTFESTPVNCSGPPPTGECGPFVSSAGAFVIVEAHPDEGSEIEKWEWTGEVSPEESGCEEEGEAFESCSANNPEGEENTLTVVFKSSGGEVPLTVEVEGPGSVTGEGINCPEGECSNTFPEGKEVALSATAGEHAHFIEWETIAGDAGSCEGAAASCEAGPLNEATTLKAKFAYNTHTLNVEVTGEGSVEALEPPEPQEGGIAGCEEGGTTECEAVYVEGDSVTLKAHPGEGQEVASWTGCVEGGEDECTIEIGTEDATVELALAPIPPEQFLLTIEVEGPGSVTAPEDINCPEVSCSANYEAEEEVPLTATADEHNHFVGWTTVKGDAGSCEGATVSCEAGPLTQATTLKATFAPTMRSLAIETESGEGSGQVNCEVNGSPTLDEPCEPEYQDGTELVLIPEAGSNSEFEEFKEGTGSAETCFGASCEFTIEANSGVTAQFGLASGLAKLTVHKAGNGKGTIATVPPSGLSCGPECAEGSELFGESETITLKATPQAPGSIFVSWSSNCAPTSAFECEVEVGSEGADVTATFIAIAVVTPIAPGGECGEAGGVKVEYAGASYNICNGEAGSEGEPGETPTITSFTKAEEEAGTPPGHPCNDNGGTMIELGATTSFVCNGEEGSQGEPGETPTITVTTFSGEAHGCLEGGSDVDFALGATHVHAYICNGEKGAQGEPGETPTITEFSGAQGPCAHGGVKIELGATTTYVCNGADGTNGSNGSNGVAGPQGPVGPQGPAGSNGSDGAQGPTGDTGPQGAQGPQGPQGPQGKRGPAGKVKVTCKVKGSKKVKCTVKYVTSSKRHHRRGKRHHLRWRLMHAGHTVRHGSTGAARLQYVLNHLRAGRYVLHVAGQRGGTRLRVV